MKLVYVNPTIPLRKQPVEDRQMVTLAQTIVPYITGAILVMANPLYSYSIPKIVDNGQSKLSLSGP